MPDETRYGEIPREMIAGGDWVVPHLNGSRYFEKPPLAHWVHAGSILLFGENNFAVRLPSALSVGLSAWLVFLLTRRAGRGDPSDDGFSAVLAVMVYLSCFGVLGVGNIAVVDSLFSFFLTGSVAAFFLALEKGRGSAGERGLLLLAGLSCGLAILVKGFLGFAVPVMVLGPLLLWQRRGSDLIRMTWLPALTAVLVALPWTVMIHQREPDFWRYFFWNEHVRRFAGEEAQHKESVWFFVMVLPVLMIPWTFLVPAAVAGLKKPGVWKSRAHLMQLCACWVLLPFLFFSVSSGKLMTYIIPIFPPLSIFMGYGLSQAIRRGSRRPFLWGVAITVVLFGVILLGLIYAQTVGIEDVPLYLDSWRAVLLGFGVFGVVAFCVASLRSEYGKRKAILMGLAPLGFCFVAHFGVPDSVVEKDAAGHLLEKHRTRIGADTVLIACEESVGAVCWNFKRDDVYLLPPGGELDYGLSYPDADGRLLDEESAIRLIEKNRDRLALVGRAERMPGFGEFLPEPVSKESSGSEGFEIWFY